MPINITLQFDFKRKTPAFNRGKKSFIWGDTTVISK